MEILCVELRIFLTMFVTDDVIVSLAALISVDTSVANVS